MKLDLKDGIARSLYLYGTYDPAATSAIQSLLKPGHTFVDVGANIGAYSLMASRIVGPSGSVYCFEASPRTAKNLAFNIALNQATNVVQAHCAVSDVSGTVELYDYDDPVDWGRPTLTFRPGVSKTIVKSVTLDTELRGKQVNLLKIDVEGCDDRVVAGATKLLTREDPPTVLCEGEPDCPAAQLLRGLGYSIEAMPHRSYFAPNFIAVRSRSR
jgi:FkbM family methyltransferase